MRIVPKLFVFLFVALMAATAFGQDVYRNHMLIEVYPESEARLKALYQFHQLDIIPGPSRDIPHIAAYPEDLELLQQEGYPYEIIHENLEKFYADRIDGRLDDMGGYHTYSEIVTFLDQIHADHPAITTAKFSIGQTIEGRDIWGIKLSDNPDVDENEPEVFFNSLTHAREAAGMEVLLYFMDYLTDNYGDSADATYVVDNREIYVIPCMNPDGYVYNETTNPGGGGMWRKNRRDNGGGCWGVDLNRNYGAYWGYDDNGSSPDPCYDTYRGTAAFSEPETQAVRQFFLSRNFVSCCDNHCHGEWLLVPYGSSSFGGDGYTDDHETFMMVVDSMAQLIYGVNGNWYEAGPPWETLMYNVNGGSFDWEYDSAGVFAISPEIGTSFWPSAGDILPMSQDMLPANIFFANIAGSLPSAESGRVIGTVRDAVTLNPIQAHVEVVGGTQATTCSPTGEYILVLPGDSTYTLQYSLYSYVSQEHIVSVAIAGTTYQDVDLVPLPIITVFSEDFESGAPGWTHSSPPSWDDQWHISTEQIHGGTYSYKCGDTGTGTYANLLDAQLISPAIPDLPSDARLTFWMQIQGELSGAYPDSAYDGGILEVSADGGAFTQVTPEDGYPKIFRWTSGGGSPATGPMLGMPCWAEDLTWVQEAVELSSFAGQSIQLRYRFGSDAGGGNEGWYVDDVEIVALGEPVIEVTGLTILVEGNDLHLRWDTDANYGYRIYDDDDLMGDFTNLIGETTSNEFVVVDGVASGEIKFYVIRGWDGASY